jgi:aminoglycoside phosphotransferase family enzyme/predicted kinase
MPPESSTHSATSLVPVVVPSPIERAQMVETHGSIVVMIGDRAYKLLKPIDLGFMDNRRREAREAACRREVAVNRRFAPEVYLGVMALSDEHGALVDHLIVMRRLPASMRLGALLEGPEARRRVVEVARAIARVHAEAPTSAEIASAGEQEAVRFLWEDGIAELRLRAAGILHEELVDKLETLALAFVDGRGPLFRRRAAAGWVRDGHGDLLVDDVYCLPGGPQLLDCLAFDDRLRHGDVLLDVAFLAMDIEARGHPGLAGVLMREWAARLDEDHPRSLEHHYVAYRAHIRSKVACLRAEQGDDGAAREARRLHALAVHHLEAGEVRLAVVGGAPGTGKSTVATALARGRGWHVERSDAVRKEIAGLPPVPAPPEAFREGIYAPSVTDRVYREMLERAERALSLGQSVVLDASWTDSAHRDEARRLAGRCGAALLEIECVAPAEVAMERVRARRERAEGPSDATPELARTASRERQAPPTARVLDTHRPLEAVIDDVLRAVGPA